MDADVLFLVGRIIFGGYWIYNGYNHFMNSKEMTAYVVSKKLPYPELAVYVSGIFILLGGLGIFLGAYIKFAVALLAIFLVAVSYKMHDYWNTRDPQARMFDQIQFYKNMALLGATLMLLAIPTPWFGSLE